MVEVEVNQNPLGISSSFLAILKDSKDVLNISVVKLILTLQSVNMYVKKGVIHKKLSNKHVVCLDFLTPNRVNIQ